MNARLIKLWQDLQSSYYFIPALMALGAIILAFVTSHIDKSLDPGTVRELGWFYSNSADGARAILSTIAGSMITVAGVTFSMTMVAVTSAAAQYGPRLIGNFMRDRANQFTLGTFTSTFVYCLLIMRVARIGDGADVENAVSEIVPNISLLVALGLTLLSVGVLIYFIHHIPETLNVGNITAKVGRKLRKNIDELFPDELGDAEGGGSIKVETLDLDDAVRVSAVHEGYIQALDEGSILKMAAKWNLVVRLQYRPGDFCVTGNTLAHLWGVHDQTSDEVIKSIRSCFAVGQERTVHQNILFLADELVEILARALSPGINDPFTAINCMNWFHSALAALARKQAPSAYRYDDDGELRVIAHPISFERFLSVICDQSRPYIATDRNATFHMLTVLTELTAECDTPDRKQALRDQIEKLFRSAKSQLDCAADVEDLKTRYDLIEKMLSDRAVYFKEKNEQSWVGGRA